MIYINMRENKEEAIKLFSLSKGYSMDTAASRVNTFLEAYSKEQYPNMNVSIQYHYTPYPACCALQILAQARVLITFSIASVSTRVTTCDEAVGKFLQMISKASGGGTLVADRADGSGEQIPLLKKLDWASVGMTLEPCISLNNPNYNSDVGVWLLRKHTGQVRRKLEDMK